jgi:hypothetical protein
MKDADLARLLVFLLKAGDILASNGWRRPSLDSCFSENPVNTHFSRACERMMEHIQCMKEMCNDLGICNGFNECSSMDLCRKESDFRIFPKSVAVLPATTVVVVTFVLICCVWFVCCACSEQARAPRSGIAAEPALLTESPQRQVRHHTVQVKIPHGVCAGDTFKIRIMAQSSYKDLHILAPLGAAFGHSVSVTFPVPEEMEEETLSVGNTFAATTSADALGVVYAGVIVRPDELCGKIDQKKEIARARELLVGFYKKHAPANIDHVDIIMSHVTIVSNKLVSNGQRCNQMCIFLSLDPD